MTALMLKIKAEDARYIAVETLGKKNEKEALVEATRYLTKATTKEIEAALKEIEGIKGKKYTGDLPFAGIIDTLSQGGITQAELPGMDLRMQKNDLLQRPPVPAIAKSR